MSQITNGEVAYGRTIKTGDFENKRVDVKLSFSVGEGESHEGILNTVSHLAISKAHEMAGLAKPAQPAAPAVVTGTRVATDKDALATAAAGGATGTTETVKRGPGRPPKVDKPAAPAAAAAEAAAIDVVTEQTTKAEDVVEDDASLFTSAAVEITDKDLTEAVTKKNQEVKNPPAIRKLIGEFAGPPPKTIRDVPAAVRAKFLEKLAEVKALA